MRSASPVDNLSRQIARRLGWVISRFCSPFADRSRGERGDGSSPVLKSREFPRSGATCGDRIRASPASFTASTTAKNHALDPIAIDLASATCSQSARIIPFHHAIDPAPTDGLPFLDKEEALACNSRQSLNTFLSQAPLHLPSPTPFLETHPCITKNLFSHVTLRPRPSRNP